MIEQSDILNLMGSPKKSLVIGIELFLLILVYYGFFLLNKIKSENLKEHQFVYKEIMMFSPTYLIPILINYFIPTITFAVITVPFILIIIVWMIFPVINESARNNFYFLNKIMNLTAIIYWSLTIIFLFLRFG